MSGSSTATIDSPVGALTLTATDEGLTGIEWPVRKAASAAPTGAALVDPLDHPILFAASTQLEEYFAGTRQDFDLPISPQGTGFQLAAWDILRTIPYGATITYGEQARQMGRPSAARAVGAANGRNPLSIVVPCHRVVASTGALTGFAGGLDVKAALLDHERCNLPDWGTTRGGPAYTVRSQAVDVL